MPKKKSSGKKVKLLSEFVGTRLQQDQNPEAEAKQEPLVNKSQMHRVTNVQSHKRAKSQVCKVTNAQKQQVYKRVTYSLRPDQIKALKLQAVEKERDLSALIREVFDKHLTQKA